MKKYLFLLLFTTIAIAQNPTRFPYGVQITGGQTTTATTSKIISQETNGTLNTINATALPVSTATQTAIDEKANKDSGLLLGGGLSINADPTKYDLAFGEGYVTNSLTGVVHHISWGTQTALTTPYRTTSVATYVLMADAGGGFGTITLQNTAPTPQQYRTHIYLGKLAHTTFTNILFAVSEPSRMFDIAGQVSDVNLTLGARNISGNVITYNGANLNINASAGQMYRAGANYLNDRNSPSITTESAFTAGTFRNKFRNGSGGWTAVNTSVIDPNFYDDGTGILAAVPNNKWTIKVLWRFGGTGTIHCDYGQAIYDNKADAILAIDKAITAEDPENVRDAAKRGWLVVKKGATALNVLTDAEFFKAGKDGERIAGGSSTATLQAAYDNSITPHILTSTGGGAVTIKRGSAADSDNILVGQNGAGTNTFSVTGAGNITAGASTSHNVLTDFSNAVGYRFRNSSGNTVFQVLDQGASQGQFRAGTASAYIEGRESGPQYLKTSIPLEVPTATDSNHAVNKAYADALIINETTGVFSNIQTLINANPAGTTINLKPNTTYIQQGSLTVKEGITINGNGATLQRGAQVTTTLTVSANQASTSITVAAIPSNLAIGDRLSVYNDDTRATSSQPVIVTNIVGNVITLKNALLHATLPTYTWAIGSIVRKDYDQITTPYNVSDFPIATTYTIDNLILDGNKSNNAGNFYWAVNSAIFNNGKSVINKCNFINMPNECIMGGGMTVKNCYVQDTNGSFIHQSVDATIGESVFGGEVSGNTTKNTNLKSNTITGHSEGVITFSFTSGRVAIIGNRFLGGGESVLGIVASSVNAIDGANKNFIFTGNYAENFTKVVYAFNYFSSGFVTNADNWFVNNNTFSNCGVDDWSTYASNIANMGVMKFTSNILSNGTVISNIPEKMKSGFLLTGGTVNNIPKYDANGYLTAGSITDNGTNVVHTKPIFKVASSNGTIASPVWDKNIFSGLLGTHESGIEFGNTLTNNNGTMIRIRVNDKNNANTPLYPMYFNSDGTVTATSLSGTGTRTVVADASGNLSATIDLATKADLASPTFTGDPKAPTPTAGDNDTSIATTAFVQNAMGNYKKYVALISQSGTSAPTATVLENTLGGTVVWTRTGTGVYAGTLSGVFTTNKTTVSFSNGSSGLYNFGAYSDTVNTIALGSQDSSTAAGVDDAIFKATIEIRVYP